MATEALDEKKAESGGAPVSEGAKDGDVEVNEEEAEDKSKAMAEEEVKEESEKEEKEEIEEEEEEEEEEKRKKASPSATEPVTPKERPTRERKAVERYSIASPASRSSSGKPLSIAKGSGTPLKDIPNVAFKLSKRKPDDNLQLLHTILFGKKAKVHNLKRDIGQFSGFVWVDTEGKQRAKIKEKIDKCVKEKLLDFCDVLNIPINKSVVKKEDLSVKLLVFLESPHLTTEILLAEKDQKTKRQKGKGTSSRSRSSKSASAEKSAKKTQSEGKRKRESKAEEENVPEDKGDDSSSESNASDENEDDAVQKEESDKEESDSGEEEEEIKERPTSPKSLSKDKSGAKSDKEYSRKKASSDKSGKSPAKSAKKTSGASKKSVAVAEAPSSSSKAKGSVKKKQKVDDEVQKEEPVHVEDKSATKKQAGKSAAKSSSKGKGKASKESKPEPTTEELRAEAVNILKEVDFNTATLSDIIRLLGSHFALDLMHRKGEVKTIITEIIESMSNDDDEEGEDDDDEEGKDNEDGMDSGKE